MNAIDDWIEKRRELKGQINGLQNLADKVSNSTSLSCFRNCELEKISHQMYVPSRRIYGAIVDEIKVKIKQLQQELDEHEKRVSIS